MTFLKTFSSSATCNVKLARCASAWPGGKLCNFGRLPLTSTCLYCPSLAFSRPTLSYLATLSPPGSVKSLVIGPPTASLEVSTLVCKSEAKHVLTSGHLPSHKVLKRGKASAMWQRNLYKSIERKLQQKTNLKNFKNINYNKILKYQQY